MDDRSAHHLLPEEIKALERAHGLRTRLDVSEHDMSLSSHLLCSHGNHIKNGAVGREKRVQGRSEIRFLNLVGQVLDIKAIFNVSALCLTMCDLGSRNNLRLIWSTNRRSSLAPCRAIARGSCFRSHDEAPCQVLTRSME